MHGEAEPSQRRAPTRRRWTRPRFLSAAFDPHNNSLNAIRLVLATLVIVSHAWPIGGFGPDPRIGGVGLGEWAVAGFFAISGYLITASRVRSPLRPYLWRRFLRIFPGLWVCLLVVGLIFAPIAALIERGPDHFAIADVLKFIGGNALLDDRVGAIGGTLSAVPYPQAWDGSLWTLFYEFCCYLILGGILGLPFIRRRPGPWLLALLGVSLLITILAFELNHTVPFRLKWLAYLGTYFWAGALLFIYAARVRIGAAYAAAAVAVLVLAAVTKHVEALAAIPFAFLMLWLGTALPFQRIGRRNDISYGVYIYAFPVQQLLVLVGAQHLGVALYILLGIACTVPFALASWFSVERPAMGLKRRIRGAAPPAGAHLGAIGPVPAANNP
jgi:peptidoglycan/LPS O-acetylase OafA/YrhL